MQDKYILAIIAVLSLIGIGLSSYLTEAHYALSEESFCDINAQVSCTAVNTSVYSELFGISVALLGVIWFLAIFGMAFLHWRGKHTHKWMVFWSVSGVAFVGYLILAEILLRAFCILCTSAHIIVLLILALTILLYRNKPSL